MPEAVAALDLMAVDPLSQANYPVPKTHPTQQFLPN